jgi:hypothetical protein
MEGGNKEKSSGEEENMFVSSHSLIGWLLIL